MKKNILFTVIAAVTCMLAGCEQDSDNLKVTNARFSVSPNRQVTFAPGNLQYTQSTGTWAFAAEQYEMLGTDNVVGGDAVVEYGDGYCKEGAALADKIDLFGWSGSTATAKWGVSISGDEADYSGDFADWGQNLGDGKTWRTLTNDEWEYLINTRTNASALSGVARINLSEDGTKYANGLIFLPDKWAAPDGVTFKSGFASKNSIQAYADYQMFTLEEWQKLEQAGAVFLPASGFRCRSGVYWMQDCCRYWSATCHGTNDVYCFAFIAAEASAYDDYYNRYDGCAVRLVRDVN